MYVMLSVMSVSCSFVVTNWDLALLCVMFSCVLSHDVLDQVWCLIVSISDVCLLTYI